MSFYKPCQVSSNHRIHLITKNLIRIFILRKPYVGLCYFYHTFPYLNFILEQHIFCLILIWKIPANLQRQKIRRHRNAKCRNFEGGVVAHTLANQFPNAIMMMSPSAGVTSHIDELGLTAGLLQSRKSGIGMDLFAGNAAQLIFISGGHRLISQSDGAKLLPGT